MATELRVIARPGDHKNRPSKKYQGDRFCFNCKRKLSLYNGDVFCGPCNLTRRKAGVAWSS